jgi:hypothetical protein
MGNTLESAEEGQLIGGSGEIKEFLDFAFEKLSGQLLGLIVMSD